MAEAIVDDAAASRGRGASGSPGRGQFLPDCLPQGPHGCSLVAVCWIAIAIGASDSSARAAAPPNDLFANAQLLVGSSGTLTSVNTEATKEAGEPIHAGNPGGHSVWYRWVPTVSGVATFNTAGSALDTLLGVYIGLSVSSLTLVTQNDDFQPPALSSAVTFSVLAGRTYYLAVDGFGGATGGFTLSWRYPQVLETILSLAYTNQGAYVIDSDAANNAPGYERDAIMAFAAIRSVNVTPAGHPTTYTLNYRLLGPGDVPHPIYDAAGAAVGSTLVLTSTFPINASATITNVHLAAIRPAARLDPYASYRVELQVLRQGTVSAGPAFSGSQSFLHFTNQVSGDLAWNIIGFTLPGTWARTSAVKTVPGKTSFTADVTYGLFRYDDFGAAAAAPATVPVRLLYELREAGTGMIVPLQSSQASFTETVLSFEPGSLPHAPRVEVFTHTLNLEPAPGQQLNAVDRLYQLTVTLLFGNQPATPLQAGNTAMSADQRLLHFNGHLFFGALDTVFTSLAADPPVISVGTLAIRSTLSVNNLSGAVVGSPKHVYGDGTALNVVLRPNGNAELTSGSVNLVLNPAGIDLATNANVRFIRGPIALTAAGAVSDVSFFLPSGLGYTIDPTNRYVFGTGAFPAVALNQSLVPAQDLTLPATLWINEETKPIWIQVSSTTWAIQSGAFVMVPTGQARYVRQTEFALLEAAPVPVEQKLKRSNDSFYRYLDAVTGIASGPGGFPVITARANAQGAAELTFHALLTSGRLLPHLPYAAQSSFGGGDLIVTNDLVNVAASSLQGVSTVRVPYNRDCLLQDCGGATVGPKTNDLLVPGELRFTLDGGLAATGTLAAASSIQLGYIGANEFAHQTDPFAAASFLMPGTFLRGDQFPALLKLLFQEFEPTNGPGVLLLTGFQPQNRAQSERPWDPAYLDPSNGGTADYGGLNFRRPPNPSFHGRSVLGGQPTGDYGLTARSKYYARWGGVSGIHEATPGTFASQLTIYGYHVAFANFGLAFLDSQNVESATQGRVDLPLPAGFFQNFDELKFSCLGDLTGAKVPASEAGQYKWMNYWNADFVTLGIRFDRDTTVSCAPGLGFLTLGVKAHATHVDGPLYGSLGFRPEGNLVTAADNDPGKPPDLDSRLKMPESFQLAGPPGESYRVVPVTDAYFNNCEYAPGGTAQGFLSFAGRLDVPFFEDIEVHLHTGGRRKESPGASSIPIHLMGGWATETGQDNAGWMQGGQQFFTHSAFDADNVGFPTTGPGVQTPASLAGYRNSSTIKFHPRARQAWLNVLPFDYALTWLDTGRSFRAFEPVVNFDLLVLKSDHELRYLSPRHAELVFGTEFTGLPQLNLANILFKSVDAASGTVTGSAGAFAGDPDLNSKYNQIVAAVRALDQVLDDQPRDFFQPLLDELLASQINGLYLALSNKFDPATKTWIGAPAEPAATVHASFATSANSFANRFKQYLVGLSTSSTGLLWNLDRTLASAATGTASLRSLFDGSGGNRPNAVKLALGLVADLEAENQALSELIKTAIASITEPQLKKSLEATAPALDAMTSRLGAFQQTATDLRALLQPGGQWQKELAALLAPPASVDFVALAEQDVAKQVAAWDLTTPAPFSPAKQASFAADIRKRIEDRFFASSLMAGLQTSFRQRLYDFNSGTREAVDTAFGQLNWILRDTLNETLAGLDNQAIQGLGSLAKVMSTAKVSGYAHLNGDALKELRLDAETHFKLTPINELAGHVYFLFREYDSDGSGPICAAVPAAKLTEVSMGAEGVKISWAFGNVEAAAGAKFTFAETGQSGFPKVRPANFAGNFSLKSACVKVGDFVVPDVGLIFAAGEYENYIGGKVSNIEFQGYKGSGGLFFGHIACDLKPLESIDEQVAKNIGAAPFTGLYLYAEAWVPVLNLGCPLRVSAGVGAGVFYFVEGPTYGGTMKLGIDGKILCFLGATGTVKLTGVKNPDGFNMVGTGKLCGEICALVCVDICKTANMTYKNGGFDVDF